MSSRAFNLALFVPPVPANVGDGVTVSALGPPFETQFTSVGGPGGPGGSVPPPTAAYQILMSTDALIWQASPMDFDSGTF